MKYIDVTTKSRSPRMKNPIVKVAVTDDFYARYKLIEDSYKEISEKLSNEIKKGAKDAVINKLNEKVVSLKKLRDKILSEINTSINEAKNQPIYQETKVRYGSDFGQTTDTKFKFTKAFKRRNNLGLGVSVAVGVVAVVGVAVIATAIVSGVIATAVALPFIVPALAFGLVASAAFVIGRNFLKKRNKYRALETQIIEEKRGYDLRQEKLLKNPRVSGKQRKLLPENKRLEKTKQAKSRTRKKIEATLEQIEERSNESGSVISNRSNDGSLTRNSTKVPSSKKSSKEQEKSPTEKLALFVSELTDEAFREKLGNVFTDDSNAEEIFTEAMSICALESNCDLFTEIEKLCPEDLKRSIFENALLYDYVTDGNIAGLKMLVMADLKPELATKIYTAAVITAATTEGKDVELIEIIDVCPKEIKKNVLGKAAIDINQLGNENALGILNHAIYLVEEKDALNTAMKEHSETDDLEEEFDRSMNTIEESKFEEINTSSDSSMDEDFDEIINFGRLEDEQLQGDQKLASSINADVIESELYIQFLNDYITTGENETLPIVYCCPAELQVGVFAQGIVNAAQLNTNDAIERACNAVPQDKKEEIFNKAKAICELGNQEALLDKVNDIEVYSVVLEEKMATSQQEQTSGSSVKDTAEKMGKTLKKKPNKWGQSVRKKSKSKFNKAGDANKSVKGKGGDEKQRTPQGRISI